MQKEKTLKEIEAELSESDDVNEFPPSDVITYNEIKSCFDFARLVTEDKSLNLDPLYQRHFVWPEYLQARFIDSLIKNMPIPSVCMSLDYKAQKWEMIDGKQRISTIVKFLTTDWKLPKLNDISEEISGKSSEDIKVNNPNVYRKVANASLPVNILRCDFDNDQHVEYIFTIFSRLNTSSIKLSNQEIRNAMFSGRFNDLINELDKNKNWKAIRPVTAQRDRLLGVEMVLRFFAFYSWHNKYDGRLSRFLNLYMKAQRKVDVDELNKLSEIFHRVVAIVSNNNLKITNKATTDAVLFGIAKNVERVADLSKSEFKKKISEILTSPDFSEAEISEGIAQKKKVMKRLEVAQSVFSK